MEKTPNLKLNKYDPVVDAKEPFSIELALNENWDILDSTSGAFEICDIGMSLYVDESKGKRRYLNGQIVTVNSNTQAFLERLQQITNLYPSLLCTETEWQAEKALSAFGQVGKFVFNYDDNEQNVISIRIPAIVNVQGLFNLQNLGMRVDAGVPDLELSGYPSTKTFGYYNGAALTSQGTKLASEQNSIYGNSNTVQIEAIQYPYFIQIATGQETEANITNTLELNNPYTLFDSKYSETELYNISWLKSSGQWNTKAMYVTAYDALLVEQNTQIIKGTSVDLPSGTSYIKRGLSVKLSTEEYTDYDFVIDTANEAFRLPIRSKLASSNFAKGNGMTMGLTDGTNNFGPVVGGSGYLNAVASVYGQNIGSAYTSSLTTNKSAGITTDPTKSGIELDDSNLYLYYYIGETVQNANLINVSRIEENKANINADNFSAIGKETIISLGMPDYTAGITKTINQEYTAECSGWLYISSSCFSGYPNSYVTINGVQFTINSFDSPSVSHYDLIPFMICKGDIYTTQIRPGISTFGVTFYPMRGAINE